MKNFIIILSCLIASFYSFAQNGEKTVSIIDNQREGLYKFDTSTVGKTVGELYLTKVKIVAGETSEHPNTVIGLLFEVVKMDKNKLTKYQMVMEGNKTTMWNDEIVNERIYTKASYFWLDKNILQITFIDPKTNTMGASMKLQIDYDSKTLITPK